MPNEEWSDQRKWWMGLLEKAVVGGCGLLLTLFWVDRYQAAVEERRARQEALAETERLLSSTSLDYGTSLWDAYYTPCGKEGRARVRHLQDQAFFGFVNAVEAITRSTRLFREDKLANATRSSAGKLRSAAEVLYKNHVHPMIQCGCSASVKDLEDRAGPKDCAPSTAFKNAFGLWMHQRKLLLDAVALEYQAQASRSLLGLLWRLD